MSERMNKIIRIHYDAETPSTEIRYGEQTMDISRIKDKPIEEWAYPFIIKRVRWNGIYDELCAFLGGEKEFTIYFDGTEAEMEILKDSLKKTPAKIASTDNKVFILYSKGDTYTTKITVNGKVFDTAKIQNRSIDEWINSFQFRDNKWDGIFEELENYLNTDCYTIQFVGEQEDMKELMKKCPENVDMVFRAPVVAKKAKAAPTGGSKLPFGRGGNAANQASAAPATAAAPTATAAPQARPQAAAAPTYAAAGTSQGIDLSGGISGVANQTLTKMKEDISDAELQRNLQNIPIKNDFIRQNIMAICAALSILFAILPFMKFSSDVKSEYVNTGSSAVLNGFTAIFGENGSIFATLMFLGPILIIIMNYIPQLKPFRRAIAIAAPLFCILAEVAVFFILRGVYVSTVKSQSYEGVDVSVSAIPHVGFYLMLLSYILTAVVGFMTYYGLELPKKK
jgi:hypothetical protein